MKSKFSVLTILFCIAACGFMIFTIVKDYLLPTLDGSISDLPAGKIYSMSDVDDTIKNLIVKDANRYAYTQLDKNEKEAYNCLLTGFLSFANRIDIKKYNLKLEDLQKIFSCIQNDYPEVFWVNNNCNVFTKKDQITDCNPEYLFSKADTIKMVESVLKIREMLLIPLKGKSDYEKIEFIFDYLVDNTTYDTSSYELYKTGKTDKQFDLSCTIYGTLTGRKALCEGYSKSAQFLLMSAGIDTMYVTGKSKGEGHAWNIVKLEDAYYGLDVTWCDPRGEDNVKSYGYFLCDQSILDVDHKLDLKYDVPRCNGKKYNYYTYNGYELGAYNVSDLQNMIYKAYKEKRELLEIHCTNKAAYEALVNAIKGQEIFECFSKIESELNRKITGINYGVMPEINCVRISYMF